MTTERKATLTIDGQAPVDFPIMSPTHGNDCVDIRTLGARPVCSPTTPVFSPPPAANPRSPSSTAMSASCSIAATRSSNLPKTATFLEVTYLLKNGELPNAKQKADFENTIKNHTMVHEQLSKFYSGFRRDAHPMAVMTGVVGALSAFYHDAMDFSDAEHRNVSFNRLVAKMPTIVAMAYKYNTGAPFMYPDNELDYTANFMRMMFGNPCEKYVPNPVLVVRSTPSSRCTPITSRMLRPRRCVWPVPPVPIRSPVSRPVSPVCGARHTVVPTRPACRCWKKSATFRAFGEYIARAKDKNDSFKLMGFGHRVYKNFDPRATLMRKVCNEVLTELGLQNDRLFKLAMELEKIALEDPYFVEKKLYPNVDFYSGIVQKAIGIPTEMFTCIFALARTVGWMTQWEEMITDPEYKIGRPRQLYIGAAKRDVVPLAQRG
jgi:citrate synthase